MSHSLQELKARLEELGISPKKSLGQNFLIGEGVVNKIIEAARATEPQSLIEVGPGLGALTTHLKEMGLPLRLIEFDYTLAEMWSQQGIEVIAGDALLVDWEKIDLPHPITLVSNLPYQISSSLVIDRSQTPAGVQSMVLMFQKEVAQRILAGPKRKDYSFLSVVAQSFWDIRFLLEAGPNEFYPAPSIASRVLVFKARPDSVKDAKLYVHFVKSAFAQRRKFLLKNLSVLNSELKVDNEFWKERLQELEISPQARAEELAVETYLKLFQKMLKALGRD